MKLPSVGPLLCLTSFVWATWGMPVALPISVTRRSTGKHVVAFLGPRGGSTRTTRRRQESSSAPSSSVPAVDDKSNFWPPWPFSLLAVHRNQGEDGADENSISQSQPGIWPVVRDMARLTVEQLSQVSRNLLMHLPPGMPPFLLYAVIPRTVVHKAATSGSGAAVVAERVVPLISDPFVRNVALSGFTLALMSWAHSEIHRQRCLTPLGVEEMADSKNYHNLPPFLPDIPQSPTSYPDNLIAGLSSLLPSSVQTSVLQWTQLRSQTTYEEQRARRLSVQDQLLALQQQRQKGRRGGRRKSAKGNMASSERLALVTGASRGIGRALAVELARYGINLVLVARDLERLNSIGADLEKYYGIKCYVVTADLGEPNGADKLYQATKNANLGVDILVNNAGYSLQGPSSVDMDVGDTNNLIQCNAASVSTLMHLYGNDMKHRRRGRILNMSSICGAVAGIPTVAVYSATKAFCNSLSASMALELEPFGVGVTSCMPGAVKGTELKARSRTVEAVCWKWPGYAKDPEQIAQVSIQAMLRGDTECTPGWENRFFLRVMKPAIPQRLHNVVAGIFWNPLQLPFSGQTREQLPFSQTNVEDDSFETSELDPPSQMTQEPPKRMELEQNEIANREEPEDAPSAVEGDSGTDTAMPEAGNVDILEETIPHIFDTDEGSA